ncbi:MAG: DUF3164 family protein [Salinarimonadaceae bacterium]|nr:MAG: DUF3164 family protein [Salinarimonadaceae bacterium]
MHNEIEPAPDGAIVVGGARYWRDAKGALVPEGLVRPQDLLQDQTVRKILSYAQELSAQIARFKGHTFDDVSSCVDLIAEQYGAKIGGAKGNMTLMSLDGTMKVQVQVADQISFGPELQAAKSLVDDCIERWAADAGDEIRALVNHAFDVDKEGKINRAALFQLRRLKIEDEEWKQAMAAIGDAIRVVGSTQYVRFYRRADANAPWQGVSIDIASARAPAAA